MAASTSFLTYWIFGIILLSHCGKGFIPLTMKASQQQTLLIHQLLQSPNAQENDNDMLDDSTDDFENDDNEAFNRANRFSKFAPDTNLAPDEFRAQLRENMKADLEKRRRQEPNRGNQPAKSYLEGL